MSGLTGHRTFVPTINADNHGAKVVVCGALMLPPVAMLVSLSVYNRIRAKTLLHADGMIMLFGTVLAVGTYATFVHAKNLGFGKHTAVLTDAQQHSIKNVMLVAVLLFYMSKGFVMLAYNMLARKTARSQRFFRGVDVLSAVITIWSLANIVAVAMSIYRGSSPPYWFLIASAIVTVCIWVSQLISFLWIVWSTHARLLVKMRWSLSIGLFLPACLGAVVVRLVTMPSDIFAGDWTFTSINTALAFIAEVFFSVMNLLAPNLPIFFDQTSTGGLHFVPGNTPRTTQFNSSGPSQKFDGIAEDRSTRMRHCNNDGVRGDNIELSRMSHMFTTSIRREQRRRTASFDSDAILVRRSVEVS